jgi:hypothetical protein
MFIQIKDASQDMIIAISEISSIVRVYKEEKTFITLKNSRVIETTETARFIMKKMDGFSL